MAEDLDRPMDGPKLLRRQMRDQPAELIVVQLAHAIEEIATGGRRRQDDLTPIQRIVATADEPVIDEPIDEAAHG
jgi:hypothetical protein